MLISPAAPSFDHYRDFEERGERFSELAGASGGARRTPEKNAAAPKGRRRGSCAFFQRLGAYGHSGLIGTSRHGFGIVSCGAGAGCGSLVLFFEYSCSVEQVNQRIRGLRDPGSGSCRSGSPIHLRGWPGSFCRCTCCRLKQLFTDSFFAEEAHASLEADVAFERGFDAQGAVTGERVVGDLVPGVLEVDRHVFHSAGTGSGTRTRGCRRSRCS